MLAALRRIAMKLFSQRRAEPPDRYAYVIPDKVRSRLMHTLQQHKDGWGMGGRYGFGTLLQEVGNQLLARKGSLRASGYEAARVSDDPVINHFFLCSDEEALDFIQICFQTDTMGGDNDGSQRLVAGFNRIFEEEGIGYELTPPASIDTGEKAHIFGRATGGNLFRTEFPKIIRKDERTVHEKAVKPALEALRDSRLATANGELLDAFEKVRKGDYPDAITSCGAAFESVLKTICKIKGWAYDPNKDTCAKLVGICKDGGLFFPFYAPILEGVGTVRNKLGDAHGKGPKPEFVADREHAEHMIAVTCAHIDFLVRQAGL
jgi:hypothetical protein